jgi:fused signal recognition particle receptor
MFSFLKKNSSESSDAKSHSWFNQLKSGLTRTSQQLTGLFSRGGKIDDDLYEELETILITADVGMDATRALLADLRYEVHQQRLSEAAELREALAHCLLKLLKPLEQPLQANNHKPFVIMMVGVNGAGKTTSIGKLAKYLQGQGLSVLLAAGDTFRAAAREQLTTWGRECTAGRRCRRGDLRCSASRTSAQHRRGAGRYRWTADYPGAFDGRDQKGEARHRQGVTRCAA